MNFQSPKEMMYLVSEKKYNATQQWLIKYRLAAGAIQANAS